MAGALGILILVAVVESAAGGGQKAPDEATPRPSEAPKQLFDPNASSVPQFDLGRCDPQPCANDNYGWIVAVSDVKYNADPGDQFTKPEQSNVFVTMMVTFTNKKDTEQHANPTEFVLQDGAGIKHSWRPLISGACRSWEPVNVTPTATFGPRCISFEATADKPTGLVLIWTPSGFGGGYRITLS